MIIFVALFVFYAFFGIAWYIKGVFTDIALNIIGIFGMLACIFAVLYAVTPKSKKPDYTIDYEFYANQTKKW
jgi:uncharacterized BrkB/YihY/UPF0761 family membrane protein